MSTVDPDLKEFITLSLGNVVQELNRLSVVVERNNTTMREIEIRSTTRVAELQKDIDDVRGDISTLNTKVRELGDSQKFKWRTLGEERTAEKKEQAAKDERQAVINNGIATITKLLYAVLTVMLSIGIGFVWELIKNGGLRNLP